MWPLGARSRTQQVVAIVAIFFGLATLAAGGNVLLGRDPGYVVYRPLLVFNTLMGLAYVAAGVLAWRRAASGLVAAAVILGLNLVVLGAAVYMYRSRTAVAVDSVRAMVLRCGVWLALLLVLAWVNRARRLR